jgi:hypothetical protein
MIHGSGQDSGPIRGTPHGANATGAVGSGRHHTAPTTTLARQSPPATRRPSSTTRSARRPASAWHFQKASAGPIPAAPVRLSQSRPPGAPVGWSRNDASLCFDVQPRYSHGSARPTVAGRWPSRRVRWVDRRPTSRPGWSPRDRPPKTLADVGRTTHRGGSKLVREAEAGLSVTATGARTNPPDRPSQGSPPATNPREGISLAPSRPPRSRAAASRHGHRATKSCVAGVSHAPSPGYRTVSLASRLPSKHLRRNRSPVFGSPCGGCWSR